MRCALASFLAFVNTSYENGRRAFHDAAPRSTYIRKNPRYSNSPWVDTRRGAMDVILNRRRPPPRRRMTRSHRFHQPRHSHLIITTRTMAMMTMTMFRQAGGPLRSVTRSNGHECEQSGYPCTCTSLMQGKREGQSCWSEGKREEAHSFLLMFFAFPPPIRTLAMSGGSIQG